ncbi:MAG: ATP-binding protein [Pseudomonadota bacterium]
MTNNILRFGQSRDSSDPFEPLFSGAPFLMHSIDRDGMLLKVSQFFARKMGYTAHEMLGRPIVDFLTDDSRKHALAVMLPQFYRTGTTENAECSFVTKDGKVLPVLMSAVAEYNSEGTFLRSFAILFDNSQAKENARELQRKYRMDAIGSLVGGVAHDFNNLLAVVQGNLDFLKRDPDDPERKEFIDDAVEATKRGSSLIEQLLTFGRRAELSPRPTNLNETMASACRLVERLYPSNIEIQKIDGDALWKSHVDTALLETAILNILNNARDAMPGGGRIAMETRNVQINEDFINRNREDIEPGRYVMLSISDTGHGMDKRLLSKVFEPFFTTKSQSDGSGLGLSMVLGFIHQSKGAIRVSSEPGVGTTFKMYFPVEPVDTSPLNTIQVVRQILETEKKVLIVEDDSGVRSVLARQLKDEKIEVFEAETGDSAFTAMSSGLEPDLLLTDIVMPGALQGPELAKKARAMLPDLRVLFISGYPVEMSHHTVGISPQDRQLVKPVSQDKLVAAVIELLIHD